MLSEKNLRNYLAEKNLRNYLAKKAGICCVYGHSFYGGNIDSNSIVVDLGAHKGIFSRNINKEFQCKVYAVEPEPDLFSQISETETIKKFNYAITETDGPISLSLSITQEREGSTIVPYIRSLWNQKESIVVQGVTLENFLKNVGITSVDLLKVNIEGAEIGMFKSMSDVTLRNIKQISIEMHAFVQPNNEVYVQPNNEVYIKQYKELVRRLNKLGFVLLLSDAVDMLFLNRKIKQIKLKHRLFVYVFLLIQIVSSYYLKFFGKTLFRDLRC
jgi:FkbM family methyltransferase